MGPYFNKLGSKRRYLSPEYLKKNMVPFPELQCHPCAESFSREISGQ